MAHLAKILAFAGSSRIDSFNKKAVALAAAGAREDGAEVTLLDLRDYRLPLFDQDEEGADGLPANALELKTIFGMHNGLIIASPEYNSSVTPLLKNTIDWISRPAPGEPSLAAFRGKVASLVSASPGALGGLRGLVHLRAILGNIGVIVLPDQLAIAKAHEAFDDKGELKDPRQQTSIRQIGRQLAETLDKLTAS